MEPRRKGARRRSDVTPDVLSALNAGTLETASLPEALVLDFATLIGHASPEVPPHARARLDPDVGVVQRMRTAGELLAEHLGINAYDRLSQHPSDTVRGWSAYLLALAPDVELAERLRRLRPLADDPHFGVREWAWMAIRPHLAADVPLAVRSLEPWTTEESVSLRRFAVESTRPRGVWCAHIAILKSSPELALPLLEPLYADPAKYVQDSVANWLNDAAKTQPDWVRERCAIWKKRSKSAATERICKRAMRSL